MSEKEFNLLKEPWILVMRPDGIAEEVSLLELFKDAQNWIGLAGELPTQDIAILRFLLAILHAIFARYNSDGNRDPLTSPAAALKRWKDIWGMGKFPISIIEEYLLHFQERFWLFHPEYPFYQVADLDKATGYTAAKLNGELSESSNKIRLFPQRAGEGKEILLYSEAARWLIYVNGFDDASAKPKGKGLPSPGTGWLGKLGLVIAAGDNLFQTLMLNLILLKDGGNELWGKEIPIWEVPVRIEERKEIILPDNPSELYTLQSRRMLLKRDGNFVVGFTLLGGDFFPRENSLNEQMTIWENGEKKKTEIPLYYPKRHDPTRQIWRDFSALLIQGNGWHRPGILNWLFRLKAENLIPCSHFCFQTAAVEYDKKNCSIDDVFSDSILFNANLLTALGVDWVARIIDEIKVTEKLVHQVGWLAQSLAKASGNTNGAGQKEAAKEQAYFLLDLPFHKWLGRIDPERDTMITVCDQWWEQARRIIFGLGRTLVEQAGPQAFVGRVITENKKERRYNAPEAFNRFLYYTSTREALKGGW